MTGSAGLGLSEAADIAFVQEVYSASLAIKKTYPDADCAVELGGVFLRSLLAAFP